MYKVYKCYLNSLNNFRDSNILNPREKATEIIDLVNEDDDEIFEISDDDDNPQVTNNVKNKSDDKNVLKIDDKIICIMDDDNVDEVDKNLNCEVESNKDLKTYKDEKKEVGNIDIDDVDNNLKNSEAEKDVKKSEVETKN